GEKRLEPLALLLCLEITKNKNNPQRLMKTMKPFIIACSIWLVAAHSVALAQTTFTKITNSPVVTDAAQSISVSWVDFDNDGDLDVFIVEGGFTGGGNSRLYRNDGKGVFTRITSGPLVQRSDLATSAAWGDYDNDGCPDLFLARSGPGSAPGVPSFLFHN